MSNPSGGKSALGRLWASFYDAMNNCNLEQFDAIVVSLFFLIGGMLLIGACFIGNLVGYFTPIPNVHSVQHFQQHQVAAAQGRVPGQVSVPLHQMPQPHMIAQPISVQPISAQSAPAMWQPMPHYVAQQSWQPQPQQSGYGYVPVSQPIAQLNHYSPENFGRPRSTLNGWYPFAHERFGQAEAASGPPM